MSQPPNSPGQDPQWNPQHGEGEAPRQPMPGDPSPSAQDGQPYSGPIGPDGQPYNGAAEPHRGAKFGVKQIIPIVLAVVLLGVGAFFVWQNVQKDAALAVGNCLVFTGTPEDADHELVDCDDKSIYSEYVGEVIEGDGECADPLASAYTSSKADGSGDSTDVVQITCLVPQLFEGQCYAQLPEGSVNDLEPVDCGSEDFKVTKAVDGPDAQCDEGSDAISFTVPERSYCLAFQS